MATDNHPAPINEGAPDFFTSLPSIEEMNAAGVYGPLPFDPSKLPPAAGHFPLSYLRYLYRIGDVSGLRIIGSDGGSKSLISGNSY